MTDVEDFSSYCAAGTTYSQETIETEANVLLRVITFSGPEQTSRPDIVFVAGWVSLMSGWKEVLTELTREYRILYIETREKISSIIRGRTGFGVDAIGNDVVTLISHFGLQQKKYILLGSSLGATAILDCYNKIKNKPLCLVLIGPNAEFRVPLSWKIIVKSFYPGLYALIKPAVKWYLRNFRLNLQSDREQYLKYSYALDAADPWKLKPAVLALADYQVWHVLADITCPVLVIGADEDKLHEPENLKRIVQMMPDVHYVNMHTNKETHSSAMLIHLRDFITKIC